MNCAVLVPTIFSPSDSGITTNIYNSLHSNPMSPSTNNMGLKFHQQLEGPVSTCHYNYDHRHHNVHKELPLLKRKRPAKINLPVIAGLSNLLDVNFVSSPRDRVAEKLEEVEVEGDGYGVYCKRGRLRARMEDRYSVMVNGGPDKSKQVFFGIFDGHGGSKAAEFAAAKLGKNILDHLGREATKTGTRTRTETDRFIEGEIREGYLSTDEEFLRSENAIGGTCCVTAIIREGKLVVSNVGDCRAVLSRGGIADALSNDHNPSREDEKIRIEAKGGYVDSCNGVWRIQGSLAVSRAIGDQHLKQWVTAEPDTTIIDIEPDCEFLILASDGLWNKVSNQDAVDIARPLCKTSKNESELTRACKKLTEMSVSRGSNDDTSVMIVQLSHFVS